MERIPEGAIVVVNGVGGWSDGSGTDPAADVSGRRP
jgi:hypothetical protein